MRGKFLVLEGQGGSGKSTLAATLVTHLNQIGGKAIGWRFPDKCSPLGLVCRKFIHKELTLEPEALLPLFLAHMVERAKELQTLLDDGYTVVCDRYYFSTMVYQAQCYSQSAIASIVIALNLRKPDLLVFLDLPIDVIVARLQTRGSDGDRFDEVSVATLEKYAALYRIAVREPVAARNTLHIDEPLAQNDLLQAVLGSLQRL